LLELPESLFEQLVSEILRNGNARPRMEAPGSLTRRQVTNVGSDGFQGSFRTSESLSEGNTHRHHGALTNLTPDLQLKGAGKQPFQPPTQQR
jgi:hypothetical protein